uniref:Enoyl-CoA delta isomerase 1, mitochondrial n=1 Tax=Strigamia maritima TaxID=126957 RepID=T1ILS7_STRMM
MARNAGIALLCKSISNFQICARSFGTGSMKLQNNLISTLDSKTGIAEVKMNKAPVNSLNTDFIKQLSQTIKDLENTKGCRGLILTSNVPNIFSAGLDIMEMYQSTPERMSEFWGSFQQFWMDLYGSKLATIAAINGHAPAGGCLMAMSCDYRIMASGKYTIGLNETLLGIVAPLWLQGTMEKTIGHRVTELSLQLGKLYSAEEALKIGLVDEIVAKPEDTIQKAQSELISKWLKIPDIARQITKKNLRQDFIAHLQKMREADIKQFVAFASNDKTQKALGMYLESLKKRSKFLDIIL